MRAALLAAVVAVTSAPHVVAADCAFVGLSPKVITPAGTVVPGDGGIVVAAMPDSQGRLDPGDPAVRSWKIRIGSDTVKPPVDVIAPGLAVYRVAAANVFQVELVTDKGEVVATVKPSRTTGDALAAPSIKRAWFERTGSRHGAQQVAVELGGARPAHVVALVLADAKGTPKSWTTIADTTAAGSPLFPYQARDCQALPNGTTPTKSGDTVTAFWVDAGGRRSPVSKPIVVN